jgi:hypothetical protein
VKIVTKCGRLLLKRCGIRLKKLHEELAKYAMKILCNRTDKYRRQTYTRLSLVNFSTRPTSDNYQRKTISKVQLVTSQSPLKVPYIAIINKEVCRNIGSSIRLPGAYTPSTKKTYFKMSKNLDKKFYMYISIMYVHSLSFTKNQYFLWSM